MTAVSPDVGAHSVTLIMVHVVWSTWGRWPAIESSLDDPLESTLRRKASELRAALHAFGAAPDHVHLLVRLPADVSVATLINRLKGASSHAFKRALVSGWQAGYWAESVSVEAVDRVGGYVRAQRIHHATGVRREPWQHAPPRTMEPAGWRA